MSEYTKSQKQAIKSVNKNIVVTAGAGSGKTRVLVERYLTLLKAGVDARSILALTFTNKAAGEMTERIREKIAACSKEASSKEEKSFWFEQKQAFAGTYIGTVHGLCVNIIRANPLEARVQPDFSVADENEAMLLGEDSIKNTLYRLLQKKDSALITLCREYGYQRICRQLEKLLPEFTLEEVQKTDFPQLLARGHGQMAEHFEQCKQNLLEALAELTANAENLKASVHKEKILILKENLAQIHKELFSLGKGSEEAQLLTHYLEPLTLRSSDKELVKKVKTLHEQLVNLSFDFKALDMTPAWAQVIKSCVEDFSSLKQFKSLLTFADLEHLAVKILQKPAICVKYADKYQHIMVDEFQDTNELQRKLVYLLAGQDDKKLKNNKLFIVGDDKQSIYRFRGAEVEVFAAVAQDIVSSNGSCIELLDNFRSDKQILAVCNDLFARLLQSGNLSYKPLQAGKNVEATCTRPVEILLPALEDEEQALEQTELIAALIRKLVVEQKYKFSELALLLRTKTRLPDYVRALQALQVPFNVLDGQGYFESSEIADLLNLLHFLDNPHKDLPLLAVLRSPLFGLSDETITKVALSSLQESFWEKLQEYDLNSLADGQKELFAEAISNLGEFLQKVQLYPLGILLRFLIDRLKIMPLVFGYPDGKQKYANVEKLVDIVFAFEYERNGTLSQFLEHLERLKEKEARESMEALEDELSDSVKILTIHKAKGLQFKVVLIPECEASFYQEKDLLFYKKNTGLALKVKNRQGQLVPSAYFQTLRELDKEENKEEMKRLLYVGMTRAEEKLILAGKSKKNPETQNWLNWFLAAFHETEDSFVGPSSIIHKIKPAELVFLPVNPAAGQEGQIQAVDFARLLRQTQPLAQKENELVFSATGLRDYKHCQKMFYYKYLRQIPEFEQDLDLISAEHIPGRVLGLIAHYTLQFSSASPFSEAFLRACQKYLNPSQFNLAQRLILPWLENYLAGDLFKSIREKRYLSEYQFNLPLLTLGSGDIYFSGVIDCLVFGEKDVLKIIDFKTDQDMQDKLAEYSLQLALYILAVQKIYPEKTVASAELHFLRFNKTLFFNNALFLEFKKEIEKLCQEIKAKIQEEEYVSNQKWCQWCGYTYFCPAYKKAPSMN